MLGKYRFKGDVVEILHFNNLMQFVTCVNQKGEEFIVGFSVVKKSFEKIEGDSL